ncbi:hypothetical protein P7K49_037254 [Saguinus oedipus]|uniref:Uncharacterized protein n=1 Tax=Saguinus oedipus TaxID=9490 RepID=A0ABQ9THJ8_SAGOE|nr:hypothetical protein P7K49_037254 [Saguinus oedipus]
MGPEFHEIRPPPQEFDPRGWKMSQATGAGAGVVAGARPHSAGRRGDADARGRWSNGTRGRDGRGGVPGRSLPALRAPGGLLTLLRPGALSRQPRSAAATAAPEPRSGHRRLGRDSAPLPAPAPPATRPGPRPSAAPGCGQSALRSGSPGPPTRGCAPGAPRRLRWGEAQAGPAWVGGGRRCRALSSCPAGTRDFSSPGLREARVGGASAARNRRGSLQGRPEPGGLEEPWVWEGGALDGGAHGPRPA